MRLGIFEATRRAAQRIGQCDPQWLKGGFEPEFEFQKYGNGKGPPIVLLHGLFGALSNWDAVAPLMEDYSTLYALRFPITTGHRSEIRVRALAVFAEFFIRKHFNKPVILCGNSMGGHVALRLAIASPDLVDSLILTGSSGLYEHFADALPLRPDRSFVTDHAKRVFFNPKTISEEAIDQITEMLSHRTCVLNLVHAAKSAKRDNLLAELRFITMPTLLLWGENDTITSLQVGRTFHQHIVNSKLVSIDECGHAPMIEHPEWFSSQVRSFLSAIGRIPV
jgi:2-hydroxy-6-oxonona-2,4-dienedioate hydrolase